MKDILLHIVVASFFLGSCYSFKGVSIPTEVKKYYIESIENRTPDAPPTINRQFTEDLRNKISRESRLRFDETSPDVVFSGGITQFLVTAEAPEPGAVTALNKLTIQVSIDFSNEKDEEKNWNKTFSFFEFFPANQNLQTVQDELIEKIHEQLVEDIFNAAFNNW